MHSTSPTMKRRPTSALRSIPRVTRLRRASSGVNPSSSSASASTRVSSWPFACGDEKVPGALVVAVAVEPAAGVRGDLGDPPHRGLGFARDHDRLHPARGARRAALGRRPQGDVGRRDDVAALEVGERLGSAERVPGDRRRRAVRDRADLPSLAAQDREPRAGPREPGGVGDRHQAEPAPGEPVAPHRPWLRMVGRRRGDLGRGELEDRRQAGGAGAGERVEVAGKISRLAHGGSLRGEPGSEPALAARMPYTGRA